MPPRPAGASSLQRRRLAPEPDDLLEAAVLRQLPEVDPLDRHRAVAARESPGEAQLVVVEVKLACHVDPRARHLAVHPAEQRDAPPFSFPSAVRLPPLVRPSGSLLLSLTPPRALKGAARPAPALLWRP